MFSLRSLLMLLAFSFSVVVAFRLGEWQGRELEVDRVLRAPWEVLYQLKGPRPFEEFIPLCRDMDALRALKLKPADVQALVERAEALYAQENSVEILRKFLLETPFDEKGEKGVR